MTPTWLRRHLQHNSRAATLRLCPRCKTPTITGLDSDIAALAVRCDPTPLNAIGEAIALLGGRTTYDLASGPGRKELWPRNADHISVTRRYPVLADHQCNRSLTQYAAALPERHPSTRSRRSNRGIPHARRTVHPHPPRRV